MLQLLVLILLSAHRVYSGCNDNSTIALPVQNVQLANGDQMKGVPITAGTPGQIFSCLPGSYFNDTWIYNSTATFCESNTTTSAQCEALRGGLYDGTNSSTSQGPMSVTAAGGDPSDVQRVIMPHVWINSFVTDVLGIGGSTLTKFPIGMPGFELASDYDTQCNIGLGGASVLLNSLLEAKKIVSRSYSWWWGIETATGAGAMDGQMVLGGLDTAKVTGQNYTATLTTPSTACISGMLVTITDIILSFPNGTASSIVQPGTITACLVPDFPLIITLPWTPYFANFQSATQTSSGDRSFNEGIGFYGLLYPPNAVFDGDMTIELSNGLQLQFPNDILVVPPSTVMSDGSVQKNDSIRELLINPTLEGNELDTAILGRHFFQAAYLTVDFDANTFTVSQSNPTTDTKIMALGSDCKAIESNTSTEANVTTATRTSTEKIQSSLPTNKSSTQTVAAPLSTQTSTTQHPLPVAVIAGAIVGLIIGILGLICIVLYMCHRRRRTTEKNLGETDSSIALTSSVISNPTASKQSSIFEMRAESDPHELLPYSKPQELATARWTREMSAARSPAELLPYSKPQELATARWTREMSAARSPVELS